MKKIKFSKKHIGIFKKLGVETVYLFGSHAEGRPGPLSDFDIGVVFAHPEKYKNRTMEAYSQLYDIFSEVLPKNYLKKRFEMRLHEFDIVFLQFAPVSMQYSAIVKNKVLYQSSPEKRLRYQEKVLREYLDFKYYFNIFQEATLARI
jgi:predicted nucleotidyltransferase